ncbi:hypothetical protein [Eikenella sp. NML03-A-027]|uniref:hypothetical protein n=1 Tax=Eikenella sp. NML03-A-027 TaxID=1795828 RepID=UPI000A86ADCF|nr:hypothetical protein [Eikenella sp. NML03-A-027]
MYRLMSDAANLMRLRLRPAEEYAYSLPDCLGALVMVAAVNTAMLSPVLTGQYGMIVFVFCLNLVKWPVFAGVMTRLMGALGGRRQSLWGYTLLTEVLSLPALLILYVPSLALLLQVWMAWAFAVGVMGYARLCGVRLWQVLLGYFAGFCTLLVTAMVVMVLFASAGIINQTQLEQNMQRWQEQMSAPQQQK